MGVTETSSSIRYSGNGSTTAFTFPFKVLDETDLTVIVRDNTTNVETAKTITTHYTVALDADEGGTVTMLTAPASGETLYIGSAISETQPNSITVGNLPASTLEQMYDRLTLLVHQIKELTSRVPKFVQSSSSLNKTMEEPVEGEFLVWDASGNIVNQAAAVAPESIVDGDISPTAAIALSKLEALTANRAVATDASGGVVVSTVTDTELGYVGGVTSAIQTQIDAKASASGLSTHIADTANPHSVTATQVGLGNVDNTSDATKNAAVATLTNKTLTSPVIETGAVFSNEAYAEFREATGGGSNYVRVKAPASLSGDSTYTLPGADGSSGQFLRTNGSGVMTWSTPSPAVADLTVSSITADPAPASTGVDVYLCNTSGGAFTVTLPTAVGNDGKVFVFKYTDSGFANALTIDGNSTETIDGATTTTLNTQGETLKIISDGSNWQILERRIPQIYSTYSPTTQGFGTLASSDCSWYRDGKNVALEIKFTGGTHTASVAHVGLPGSLTIDSTANPTDKIYGVLGTSYTAGNVYLVMGGAGDAYVRLTRQTAASNAFTALNGNAFSDGSIIGFKVFVPVTQWNG